MTISTVIDMNHEADALLLPSLRPDVLSVWHGHVAFAHWLTAALRPATIVELGTHNGTSYAAFCNAVKCFDIPCHCYAVDTWEGDPQAGFYPGYVYDELRRFNDKNFARFSHLLKCTFDDALAKIGQNSVDLLHIDGLHTYEAVKHDFVSWKNKLSDKSVVLFHDTNAKLPGYGVHVFWEEMTNAYPGFEFFHSAGLGVLAVGPQINPIIRQLCALDGESSAAIRRRFERASSNAHSLGKIALHSRSPSFSGSNIALGCSAIQSSYLYTDLPTASAAVNGKKTGGASFHTAYEEAPWWQVDLRQERSFETIVVYNRIEPGCIARSQTIEILLSNDEVSWKSIYKHVGEPFGGVDGDPLVVSGHFAARYVRMRLEGREYLHLDQVELYANQHE